MHSLTAGFAKQCRQAVEIARAAPLPKTPATPNHVVITGLGGSAAGGDLLSALYADQGRVPCLVNRDYTMPNFVGPESLVFATSYSGNTEETLSAYADAKKRGANIIVVSSGGEITARAKADGFPVVTVPGGQPPRTAMGYMFMPLVVASEQLGLIPRQDYDDAFSALESVAQECGFDSVEESNPAKQLAQVMTGKFATLYGEGSWQFAITQRWRGQINENAKEMVLTHVFPELCHNEILGWEGSDKQGVEKWVSVLLAGGSEPERIKKRIDITCQLIGDATAFHTVTAHGKGTLAKMLSLAHFGDWLSLYLAALAGRDPGQMIAIDRLKEELSRIN
ncbi:MAG: bifunctional phosphoglucose/phosphomannose isomerase [Fimbriimonadaceae bacterium]|nr:MAG: bifunctional phosphoglucose/phosphomannose isomerase [Fimbriimonadaceae bacterium]